MAWTPYRLVFRLEAPLHVGWRKVGNLQVTRPYVPGRTFWGALVARMTRDTAQRTGQPAGPRAYRTMGERVDRLLASTYFYPATRRDGDYQIAWPWEDPATFRFRFLSSCQGTPITDERHAAEEGGLHEVEFLSPRTLDTGEPVHLVGYLFERAGEELPWKSACRRLRLGGERGYGWGRVELVHTDDHPGTFFDGLATWHLDGEEVTLTLPEKARLLAHTLVEGVEAQGDVEPLVGRAWGSGPAGGSAPGADLEFGGLCLTPGSELSKALHVTVGPRGVWRPISPS